MGMTQLIKAGYTPSEYLGYLTILSMDGKLVAVNNQADKRGWILRDNCNLSASDIFKISNLSISGLRGVGMNSRMRLGFLPVDYQYSAIPLISSFILGIQKSSDGLKFVYDGVIFYWDCASTGTLPNFDKNEYTNILRIVK